MVTPKFDEHDRRKVISEVEKHFGVSLSRSGSRRKALASEEGKSFWIFGGYDNWHGIPPDMIKEEEKRNTDGVLVVAKRYAKRIDVYAGPLKPMIEKKKSLSQTKKGDYQFNIHIRGNHLFIKEIPDLSLPKLGAAVYSGDEKGSDKKLNEIKSLIDKMSPDERKEFIKGLSDDQET